MMDVSEKLNLFCLLITFWPILIEFDSLFVLNCGFDLNLKGCEMSEIDNK